VSRGLAPPRTDLVPRSATRVDAEWKLTPRCLELTRQKGVGFQPALTTCCAECVQIRPASWLRPTAPPPCLRAASSVRRTSEPVRSPPASRPRLPTSQRRLTSQRWPGGHERRDGPRTGAVRERSRMNASSSATRTPSGHDGPHPVRPGRRSCCVRVSRYDWFELICVGLPYRCGKASLCPRLFGRRCRPTADNCPRAAVKRSTPPLSSDPHPTLPGEPVAQNFPNLDHVHPRTSPATSTSLDMTSSMSTPVENWPPSAGRVRHLRVSFHSASTIASTSPRSTIRTTYPVVPWLATQVVPWTWQESAQAGLMPVAAATRSANCELLSRRSQIRDNDSQFTAPRVNGCGDRPVPAERLVRVRFGLACCAAGPPRRGWRSCLVRFDRNNRFFMIYVDLVCSSRTWTFARSPDRRPSLDPPIRSAGLR